MKYIHIQLVHRHITQPPKQHEYLHCAIYQPPLMYGGV